jgi:hypothetical protein
VAGTLVLHPGALGDVLLAVPALRALRAAAPGDALTLAAQPRIGRLLAGLGIVDGAVDFDTLGLDALFADGPLPERLARLAAGARVVSWFGGKDADFARRLRALAGRAVVAASRPAAPIAVWRHLLASVEPFVADTGSACAPVEPLVAGAGSACAPVRPSPDMVAAGARALAAAGFTGVRPLVMVHPGAGGAGKRWPAAGFADVVEAIVETAAADVVLHEGPADHEAAAALRARLGTPAPTLAEPPLETLAGAVHHAALWIGNDSGVSHLAAAVGAPALILFAAANLGWRPWARDAYLRVVSIEPLARGDVDGVIADAVGRLRAPRPRAAGVPGLR